MSEWLWRLDDAAEAVAALARAARLERHRGETNTLTLSSDGLVASVCAGDIGSTIEGAAHALGLEAQALAVGYRDIVPALQGTAPGVMSVRTRAGTGLIAVLTATRRRLRLLTPRGELIRTTISEVVDEIRAAGERDVEVALRSAEVVPGWRQERARAALAEALLSEKRIATAWHLRPGWRAGTKAAARNARLVGIALRSLATHLAEYGLFIASWWLLGRITLTGRIEPAWVIAWALLFIAWAPIRALSARVDNRLAIDLGTFVRRRMLGGTFRLDPDRLRQLGVGQTLGRALEADAIENVAVAGGVMAITSAVDLVIIGILLLLGVAPAWHLGALAVTSTATAYCFVRYYRERRQWTVRRLGLSYAVIEQVAGHRTRVAQDTIAEDVERNDVALARYHDAAARMDTWNEILRALPRIWFLLGILSLIPALIVDTPDIARIAISLGGIILAARAFFRIGLSAEAISRALIAWRRIRPFLNAPDRDEPGIVGVPKTGTSDALVLIRGLGYRYPGSGRKVFTDVHLDVHVGERLMIEGPSGSGKSTFAAVVAGQRRHTEGAILLRGYDIGTLGAGWWRKRVAYVPQFHDNHLVMGSLAFNLLMGREWPPTADDLAAAERVCVKLGLGPLLERMPGGLFQLVGETGWQLSHGEKSRIFLARALLQEPDVLLLDESFAALDPETLRICAAAVLEFPGAVLAIAHP